MHYLLQKTTLDGTPTEQWFHWTPLTQPSWDDIDNAARFEDEDEARRLRDDWNDFAAHKGLRFRVRMVAEQGHLAPPLTVLSAIWRPSIAEGGDQ